MKNLILILVLLFANQVLALTIKNLKKQLDVMAEEFQNLKFENKEDEKELSIQNRIRGNKTTQGGYGEFIYTDAESKLEDGSVNSKKNPIWDAQRFILYIGYDFSSKWKLFSEIEIEHAKEIYLEQAYLSYQHSKKIQFNIGVLLVPIGITNLYHEPTTFLATQRPTVEKKIIPSTWRENGVSLTGQYKNLRYQFAVFNSLVSNGFSSDGVREGRQKASQTDSSGLSFVQQTDYLLDNYGFIGFSVYHGDVSDIDLNVDQTIWDLHANLKHKGFQMRVLYTELFLTNVDDLNAKLNNIRLNSVAKKMSGYFVELGYNVFKGFREDELIPFIRYESLDTQKSLSQGFVKDLLKDQENITIGLNYKPLTGLVFKADYTVGKNKAKKGYNTWNFGAGWNF